MTETPQMWIHVLVYQCPRCGEAISIATMSTYKSHETVDQGVFPVSCACGWSAAMSGLLARKHFVDVWG